ncbi:uncharacterized protein [Halyomorpha halys]|uniref:uncharacterized protein n=1 Tax=Halyomorpha halys TaxID=286706 RepID=UPI0006D4D382|nr:uncharacterized protein LOC106686312 [Halyomorpha halys]
MSFDDDHDYYLEEEVNEEEEEEIFDNLIEEEIGLTESELKNQKLADVKNLIKLLDHIPKRTMHERLRYRQTSHLNKIIEQWMKDNNLRGLDYFHLMKGMLKYSLTRRALAQKTTEKDKKTGKRSLNKMFANDKSSSNSSSHESEPEIENPCVEYLEIMKKECPELIESVKHKEEIRKERKLQDKQKIDNAINALMEEKYKRQTENESKRMCYLEKKDIPQDDNINLGEFLKKEGFPTPHPKVVPDEIFTKFDMDRGTFERDFPLMDEEDLLKVYESIYHGKPEEEEEDDDILGKRGRFPFKFPWNIVEGEEEGCDINLAKWEQEYWRQREEMEGKSQQNKKAKEPEMELCQLMLVRCGTSWKQELGYTEGWSDTARLGKQGRKNMEEVALKIMKRGYKFDYVLTSTLGRSWRSADLVLSGAGQEAIARNSCWELNPRHRGILEGGTELGSASRWGWLPQEWFAFTIPPPIGPRDSMPDNIARADPSLPNTLPRAENIFHVQLRVEGVWTLIRNMFTKGGKRTILVCAHKDSIEALLFQIYGFLPTDFTAWQPSYTTPIILMWYNLGEKFIPAFIDFLCGMDEAERHSENLTICWLERFVDQKLLDYNTLTEIKKKLSNGEEIPDLRELWEERFIQSLRNFENNAETIGQETRMMEEWIERGYIVTPDEELKINEDNTVFKEFMQDLEWAENAKKPLSDVLTLGEQIEWIIQREQMPMDRKIDNLKKLREFMPAKTDEATKEFLTNVLQEYESATKAEKEFIQSIDEINRAPEEKFAKMRPQTWAELKTLDDWHWAAINKKFPGGVSIPRKNLFDDWYEDTIEDVLEPEEEIAAEEAESTEDINKNID